MVRKKKMSDLKLFRVKGSLNFDLEVEAETMEDAFIIASDIAMSGCGDWYYDIIPIEKEDD